MSPLHERQEALARLQRDCPEELEQTRALHVYLREESARRMLVAATATESLRLCREAREIRVDRQRVLAEVGR